MTTPVRKTDSVSKLTSQFEQMSISPKRVSAAAPAERPHFGQLRTARGKQNRIPRPTPQPTNASAAQPLATRKISVVKSPSQPHVEQSHRRASSLSSGTPNLDQPINYARNPITKTAFNLIIPSNSPIHGFQPATNPESAQPSPSSSDLSSSPSPSPLSAISNSSNGSKSNTIVIIPKPTSNKTDTIISNKTDTIIRNKPLTASHSRSNSSHSILPSISSASKPPLTRRPSVETVPQSTIQQGRRNSLAVPPSRNDKTSVTSTGSAGSDYWNDGAAQSATETELSYSHAMQKKLLRTKTASQTSKMLAKVPTIAEKYRKEKRAEIDTVLQTQKENDAEELRGLHTGKEDELTQALADLDVEIERLRKEKYDKLEKRIEAEIASKQEEMHHDSRYAKKQLRVNTELQRRKILEDERNQAQQRLLVANQLKQADQIERLAAQVQILQNRLAVQTNKLAQTTRLTKQLSASKLNTPK